MTIGSKTNSKRWKAAERLFQVTLTSNGVFQGRSFEIGDTIQRQRRRICEGLRLRGTKI